MEVSKAIGIVFNHKPELFNLKTAYDLINKEGKYAWGTGGIELRRYVDDNLLIDQILGLIKSDQDEIIYGAIIDVSLEFRDYLKPHTSPKRQLQENHKKYRPLEIKDEEDRSFLFLSSIFFLNNPIKINQIRTVNGNPFKPKFYRSAVFIDLKKSEINSKEILYGKQIFDSYASKEEDEQWLFNGSLEENKKLRYHKFFERNPNLSKKTKEIHGDTCMSCGFNFEERYGEVGRGYIEAHHIIPFSKLEKNTKVSPIDDMVVLCANCHRIIHKFKNNLNIKEFKKIIRYATNNQKK